LRNLSRITFTIGFAITLAAPTASDAAEIKVLTSRAMNHVLTELAGAFQRTSEHKIALILAPPAEIRRRILNDEIVDVAMTGGAIIEDLVQQGKITPDSKMTLARVGVGVAVRAGSAKPDITSVEAFKRALLAARSIVYTDPAVSGASGIHFEKVLDRLGIAKEIKAKSILNARAATTPNAEIVARGEAEALRCRCQAAISDLSCSLVAMRRSRHWARSTPISISTMFFACHRECRSANPGHQVNICERRRRGRAASNHQGH
jgi:ABC-type molybdate transport system substrate-binding protein